MWRSDINQRENAMRTLFDDVSTLSPVQEEEESFDSPRRRRPATRSPLFPAARPYSPLPPLTIEVEKRVNKHDHPEEFYVRLERKMKRIYRRVFLEGGNVSSVMSTDDEDENQYANDDNRSQERSCENIEIDEGSGNEGNTEPEVISDRRLKRRTTLDNDSSDSDVEEVKSKKSKSNDSSSTDVLPRSSSEDKLDDGTEISSIAEEDIDETNYEKVRSFLEEEESFDVSYNVEKDDVETTSGSLDHVQVTFQADVHRAYSSDENVQDPAAIEEGEESLENNQGSAAPDRDEMLIHGIHGMPVDVRDAEPAGEEIGKSLEKDEGNNAMTAADRGHVMLTTPFVQPDDVFDTAAAAGKETCALLGNNGVPDNNVLPPAQEVELMRTHLVRPSVGSLSEHLGDSSHGEQRIDIEFLNRTQDGNSDDDVIEERDQGTQTSFEEACPEGWGNIFVGQPRVFHLSL